MLKIQIEHEALNFLLRFLPRELDDIQERLGDAIARGSEGEERNLTAEENTCRRLLYACQHAADSERRRGAGAVR